MAAALEPTRSAGGQLEGSGVYLSHFIKRESYSGGVPGKLNRTPIPTQQK